MKQDRILTEELRRFFAQNSSNRNYLIDYVREHIGEGTKSVALCFRGSYATLYYRCHQLLCIHSSRKGVIGEFDFRHARFTENYKQILEKLNSLRVDISNFSDKDNDKSHRYVRFCLADGKITIAELAEILEIYKNLIDDFLNPQKTEYAFDKKSRRGKSNNSEKDRQQQIYVAYFLRDDFMYYDIEYAEHYAENNGVHGRFDLLGLRREGNSYTLLLTELKSTVKACIGNSGIADHEKDYIKYLSSVFMENRKIEACETVRLLCDIFNKPCPEGLTPDNIKNVKVKFVFSDNAIEIGRRFMPSDNRIEKVYICPNEGIEKAY